MIRIFLASLMGLTVLAACETMAPEPGPDAGEEARGQPDRADPDPAEEEEPQAVAEPEASSGAASLTLRLSIAEPGGTAYVSLIDNETDWDRDAEGRGFTREASSGTVTIDIADLAPGTYAIKAFQDTDGNGELSTNALGIPNEPYGFSNNAPARFGPPGFDAASFTVGEGGTTQEITLD